MGSSDGAFDPSVRDVSVRVPGVTQTVPGLHAGAACPSWAPGVAAKNGACPELMNNSSRGASTFVETVLLTCLRAKPRRPAQPSTARVHSRRANAFPSPLVGEGGDRRSTDEGSLHPRNPRASHTVEQPLIRPRSARPTSPARGEDRTPHPNRRSHATVTRPYRPCRPQTV